MLTLYIVEIYYVIHYTILLHVCDAHEYSVAFILLHMNEYAKQQNKREKN